MREHGHGRHGDKTRDRHDWKERDRHSRERDRDRSKMFEESPPGLYDSPSDEEFVEGYMEGGDMMVISNSGFSVS